MNGRCEKQSCKFDLHIAFYLAIITTATIVSVTQCYRLQFRTILLLLSVLCTADWCLRFKISLQYNRLVDQLYLQYDRLVVKGRDSIDI